MAVEGAVAAAVSAPSAATVAAVATAASPAALLHRHLSLLPKAKLDQPRPTDARLAPMAVLLVLAPTAMVALLAVALVVAIRVAHEDPGSSASSCPDNAHNSKKPP